MRQGKTPPREACAPANEGCRRVDTASRLETNSAGGVPANGQAPVKNTAEQVECSSGQTVGWAACRQSLLSTEHEHMQQQCRSGHGGALAGTLLFFTLLGPLDCRLAASGPSVCQRSSGAGICLDVRHGTDHFATSASSVSETNSL